jgi:hypothetical protein
MEGWIMSVGPGFVANFLHQLIAALDTGKYQDIPVSVVEAHIRAGDLFPYLIRTLGEDANLAFFDVDNPGLLEGARARTRAQAEDINDRLLGILNAFAGRDAGWGVERSGLCLLLTWGVFMLKLQAAQITVSAWPKDVSPLEPKDTEPGDA